MSLLPPLKERPRQSLRVSLVMIGLWTLWLCLFSAFPLPLRFSVTAIAFIVLYGSYVWDWIEGMGFLLLVSFIFSALSLTPSGLYFVAIFVPFAILKILVQRISIRTAFQLALVIFLVSFTIEVFQGILLHQILKVSIFTWSLLFSFWMSAVVQFLFAIIVSGFFKPVLDKRG